MASKIELISSPECDFYWYFNDAMKLETDWTASLLISFFADVHSMDNISDIHVAGGQPLRIKSEKGSIIVSLTKSFVVCETPQNILNEFFNSVSIDIQAAISNGKTLTTRFALTPPGLTKIYSFRSESSSFSASLESNASITAFRITKAPPVLNELVISKFAKELAAPGKGLVMLVGSTGTGKSTTCAAIIGERLKNTYEVVYTVEDPSEFDFLAMQGIKGAVFPLDLQKEFGGDWARAETYLMRVNSDTILGGEIRDGKSLSFALNLSRSGHQVFTTLHTSRPWGVPDRMFNMIDKQVDKFQMLEEFVTQLHTIIAQELIAHAKEGKVCIQDVMRVSAENKRNIIVGMRHLQLGNEFYELRGKKLSSITEIFECEHRANALDGKGVTMEMMLDELFQNGEITENTYRVNYSRLESNDLL